MDSRELAASWFSVMGKAVGLDPRLVAGIASFGKPNVGALLDMLGRDEEERVEAMAAMLHNSSEAEINDMATIFGLAMSRVAEQQATGAAGDEGLSRPRRQAIHSDAPRRRRGQRSAEWRAERRRRAA